MPTKFASCISVICCPDPQQKCKQGSQRTIGRALLHEHGLGLVCVLPSQPERLLAHSKGASDPAFLRLRTTGPAGAHTDFSLQRQSPLGTACVCVTLTEYVTEKG